METKILTNLLKKYVTIFVTEYSNYLDKESLEIIKNINYDTILHFANNIYPLGSINLNQIYLCSDMEKVFDTMKRMPNYGKNFTLINNSSFTSYLEYACVNGYKNVNYYCDLLFYMIFKLVIKNNTGLINGMINFEIEYLKSKYKLQIPNFYKKEEVVAIKFLELINRDTELKILFKDNTSAFKYLNDNYGFRYANLFEDLNSIVDSEYNKINKDNYLGFNGIINFARDYDSLLYGDALNYILDFYVNNNLVK